MVRVKCNRTWKVGFFTKYCVRTPRHNGPHVSGDGFISYDGVSDGGIYTDAVDLEGPLIEDMDPEDQPRAESAPEQQQKPRSGVDPSSLPYQ